MLVYANSFELSGEDGCDSAIAQIAHWVGGARKSFVDPSRLAEGIRELRFADGATLSSLATIDQEQKQKFPYLFNAKLTHGQPGVPGRKWITEIGLMQGAPEQNIKCSIVLKTDEMSAKVNDPIQVTRPRIVELLVSNCKPVQHLPGLRVISLTEENANAFLYEVEHVDRRHPIVEVSCDRAGRYPVSPERLRSVLVGLAKVINVPASADTYKLEEVIGRKYVTFGGAINIISPYRQTESGGFCKTTLFLPEKIEELIETGLSIESEVLSIVTHQTNLPNSWRHTSRENVRETILRMKLQEAASTAASSQDSAVYEELLKEASEQLASKDSDLMSARADIESREANIDQLSAENESLRYNLSLVQARPKETAASAGLSEEATEAFRASLTKTLSLRQAITVVATLYQDRLVILDSAYSSAEASDRGGFQYGSKALELLMMLASTYWQNLSEGKGDQQARVVFGKNGFASKEAETLSNEGKRRRTFAYNGREILMEKHLKHGVKDSYAETLRIHFEWDAASGKIILGHCGKHLDF